MSCLHLHIRCYAVSIAENQGSISKHWQWAEWIKIKSSFRQQEKEWQNKPFFFSIRCSTSKSFLTYNSMLTTLRNGMAFEFFVFLMLAHFLIPEDHNGSNRCTIASRLSCYNSSKFTFILGNRNETRSQTMGCGKESVWIQWIINELKSN